MKTVAERFWPKVEKTDGCWLWRGALKENGYGNFMVNKAARKWTQAHRVAYQLTIGPIPEGLELDHLCRNRGCVRPDHLEIVTSRENSRRGSQAQKTHCKSGHEFTAANTYIRFNGTRYCRGCGASCHRRRRAAA